MKPFKIEFDNIQEIRIGSPYNCCDINFIGDNYPVIPKGEYQDLCAWSSDDKYLALIRWSVINNEPGFQIVLFDVKENEVAISKRFAGCCKSIKFAKNEIVFEVFEPNHG